MRGISRRVLFRKLDLYLLFLSACINTALVCVFDKLVHVFTEVFGHRLDVTQGQFFSCYQLRQFLLLDYLLKQGYQSSPTLHVTRTNALLKSFCRKGNVNSFVHVRSFVAVPIYYDGYRNAKPDSFRTEKNIFFFLHCFIIFLCVKLIIQRLAS